MEVMMDSEDFEQMKSELESHTYQVIAGAIYSPDHDILSAFGISALDVTSDLTLPIWLSNPWVIGGKTGGSCWNQNEHYEVSKDEEDSFSEFDEFLEKYFPSMTHIVYKQVMKLVKTIHYRNSEYYGNYTDYEVKYILHSDLLKILNDL